MNTTIPVAQYEALVKLATLVDLWLRTGSQEALDDLKDAVLHCGAWEDDTQE